MRLTQFPKIGWRAIALLAAGTILIPQAAGAIAPLMGPPSPAAAANASPRTCPDDLEALVDRLVPSLPSYANRVFQRSRIDNPDYPVSYVLVAGRSEFEPLPLSPTADPSAPVPNDPRQVFLTTLSRQYGPQGMVRLQQYHWLFFTQADDGWRLAMAFSRTGPGPGRDRPIAPPQDSSNSAIAQAIKIWLTDCRAGKTPN